MLYFINFISNVTTYLQHSTILTVQEIGILRNWTGNTAETAWKLCFKSSLHGWNSTQVASRCSLKGATLSVYKTSNDFVFGYAICSICIQILVATQVNLFGSLLSLLQILLRLSLLWGILTIWYPRQIYLMAILLSTVFHHSQALDLKLEWMARMQYLAMHWFMNLKHLMNALHLLVPTGIK